MTMASSGRFQVTMEVPADLVRKTVGFSMDSGGSVLKLVYRDKDDWKELEKNKDAKTGKLRFISFSSNEFAKALWHIKDRCVITAPPKDIPTAYTTGIGCHQNAGEIKDALNVKPENLAEFDCFVKAFCYLSRHIAREEMLLAPRMEMAKKAKSMVSLSKTYHQMAESGLTNMKVSPPEMVERMDLEAILAYEGPDGDPICQTWPDVYPCLLAMCGSGFGYMKVEEDGKFVVLDGCNRGGRMFLGLGSLLTDAKSFDELMKLAEEGDNKMVDVYTGDFKVQKKEEDLYSKSLSNMEEDDLSEIIFCFGKAVGKDIKEFKKADLARSLLHSMVMDTVWQLHNIASYTGVKHVFFCGSFVNHQLTRDLMTLWWLKKKVMDTAFHDEGPCPKLHFIRPGSHLGALGAMLKHLDEPAEFKRPDVVDLKS